MATSLIKKDDAVFLRVEIPPVVFIAAGAGTAVQENHRQASWIAAFFQIEHMAAGHRQAVLRVWFNFRVKGSQIEDSINL